MARDLEKRDQEYEQCVIALTAVMETAMVTTPSAFVCPLIVCHWELLSFYGLWVY